MRMFRARAARAVPGELAKELGVARRDRVLAWSELVGGGAAVATVSGLKVKKPTGGVIDRPWSDVDHAAWESDSHTIAVWWAGQRLVTPLELEGESRLPEVIRERVQASVLLAGSVVVPGGRTVRIALRKGADGGIRTQALPPPGVRLDDPAVAAVVEAALAALRAEAGPEGDTLGMALRPDPEPDPVAEPVAATDPEPEPDSEPVPEPEAPVLESAASAAEKEPEAARD